MGKYRELTSNTVIFAIGSLGSKLVMFFLLPLMTSKLLPEQYNLIELLSMTMELILPLLVLGLNEAIFRFAVGNEHKKESILINVLAFTVIEIGVIVIAVAIINSFNPTDYWYLFSLLCSVTALNNIFTMFTRGQGKSKTFAFTGLIQSVILAGLALLFVYYLDLGVIGYLWAMIISTGSSVLILFFIGGIFKSISIKSFDKKLLILMLAYCLPLVVNNLSWWIIHTSNKYICSLFLGEETAGLFAATSKLPSLINTITAIFFQAWTIATAKAIEDKDRSKFFTTIFRCFTCLVVCACGIIFVFLPFISKILLKGVFYSVWHHSALLLVSAVFASYSFFFGSFYNATLKTKMSLVSTLIGAAVGLILAFSLINVIGIYALLFSSVLCYLTITVIRVINTRKFSQVKINYYKEILSFLVLISQALVITFLSNKIAVFQLTALQAGLFALILVLRLKDIITILKIGFNSINRKRKAKL